MTKGSRTLPDSLPSLDRLAVGEGSRDGNPSAESAESHCADSADHFPRFWVGRGQMSEFDGIGDHAARAAVDAQAYLKMGFAPVPVRGKTPWDAAQNSARLDWVTLRLTTADIRREFTCPVTGVGIILGEPSQNLVDVDLDCPEARAVADVVLPSTPCVFGRPSTPRAHRIYSADRPLRTIRFRDIDPRKATMLELRSSGAQTVFPRSLHEESGECVRFDGGEAAIPASILAED